MYHYVSILTKEMDESLSIILKEEKDLLKSNRRSANIVENTLEKLKLFIYNYQFENEFDEVKFFKEIKPSIYSKLIYYRKIFNIETNRPKGGKSVQQDYLQKELDRINDFFENNREFYHYYRSGNIYMDKYFFLRGKPDIELNIDIFSFERDSKFTTSCDSHIARILANDLLESYIINELEKLAYKNSISVSSELPKAKLTWTGSKVELIELIYALDTINCFNYGKVSLKKITSYVEDVFNIDLGANISKAYSDLRIRQNRTSFLDKVKDALNKRMDNADG